MTFLRHGCDELVIVAAVYFCMSVHAGYTIRRAGRVADSDETTWRHASESESFIHFS